MFSKGTCLVVSTSAFLVIACSLGGVASEAVATTPVLSEPCVPSGGSQCGFVPAGAISPPISDSSGDSQTREDPDLRAPPLTNSFEGINFEEDGANTDFLHIPPDPCGAAGPNHVVSVVNCSIEWYTKDGSLENSQRLGRNSSTAAGSFFAPVAPVNNTFDPKVIYDQYDGRFVVVSLERQDFGAGNPSNTSRILVAVSDDSDPNGTWRVSAINSKINISGSDCWADYPGFAVDDNAVYITNNMFSFGNNAFGGARLWIINKTPFYSGGAIAFTVHDPPGASGQQATTMQPAHMFGAAPAGVGTFLVRYSGFTEASIESLSIIRVDNPLGAVSFNHEFVEAGDIDNTSSSFPGVPQSGTSTTIDGGDRRALHAVWRNNALWMTACVLPPSGADAGQVTAHWFKVDTTTLSSLSIADQGNISGNDVAANAHTFYPSIAVNGNGNMAVGFALSAATIFPGAYYTARAAGDAAGSVQPTGTLATGLDFYVRTFGGGRNRWGDYSGISLDPADELSFWIFNEYARTRSLFLGEDGRWGTRWGQAPFPESRPTCTIGAPSPSAVCSGGTIDYPVTYASANGLTVNLLASNVIVNNISGSIGALVMVLNGTTATPTVRITAAGSGSFSISIEPGRAMDSEGHTDTGATAGTAVTVAGPPTTASVGTPQNICTNGTSAGLGGNTPTTGTGTWSIVTSGFTGTFSPSATTPNATFTQTGGGTGDFVLRWTISSAPCPPSMADLSMTAVPSPVASVGGPQTICMGGTTAGLGGNTPVSGSGSWSVVSGGTGMFSNSANPNATFTHTGGVGPVIARWTVSDPPCSTGANVVLTIAQPPTTASVGGPQTLCINGTTAPLGGNQPTIGTGMWSVVSGGSGTFSPNNTTGNATFTQIGGVGSGLIVLRWTISNAPCTASAAELIVTVNTPDPPTITLEPEDQVVCANAPVTFQVSAASPTPVTYQWRKNGVAIAGATQSALSISAVNEDDAGSYDAIVRNQCSQTTSASASLGVFGAKIAGNPGELTVEKCKTVTYSVLPEGLPPYTYQWRRDGAPLLDDDRYHGSQTETLSISTVIRTDSGAYDVVVTTGCGELLSDAAVLIVPGNTDLSECSPTATGGEAGGAPCAQGVLGMSLSTTFSIVGWGAWRRRKRSLDSLC
ncbi:MAG TPA: immunoglobulin domain-containing protein [Phycisphaerae bacterium]|nr:immunoglobulin domain-containing protein [Phycisphaerae bacterium]